MSIKKRRTIATVSGRILPALDRVQDFRTEDFHKIRELSVMIRTRNLVAGNQLAGEPSLDLREGFTPWGDQAQ
jgi:hypothetical protein